MISRGIILGLAFLLLGAWTDAIQKPQRVVVHLIGCTDCASRSLGISVWDEARGADITPQVSGRNAGGFALALAPGYYRVFLHSDDCNGDRYLGVLPNRNRVFDVRMSCNPRSGGRLRSVVRLVDGMRGIAGTVPSSVRSISMWPVDEAQKAVEATISGQAYYFDEANCSDCVMQLDLADGMSARIGVTLEHANNFTLVIHNISSGAVTSGVSVHGSPFNAPETLVEGPAQNIWVLDRLGNRVAAVRPQGCQEYNLPTPFSDAGDIVGTPQYVWVSERRVGRIVRISPDGRMEEYSIGRGGYFTHIVLGSDSRIWFVNNGSLGAIDQNGNVATYQLPPPSYWLRDLTLGSDGRIWVIGAGSVYSQGSPFVAAIDAHGRSERFSIQHDPQAIVAARSGLWVAGDHDSLSFIDFTGHEQPARLPFSRMGPKLFVASTSNDLWFSDKYSNVIARASPNGSVHATYPDFGPAGISDMRIDPAGDLWIAEPKARAIEQYEKGFAIPPPGIRPKHLLFDSQGTLWYSDPDADVVGVIGKGGRSECYAFRLSLVRNCAFSRMDLVSSP